jgi:diguanylate cyclase (GGDEF)-like protein
MTRTETAAPPLEDLRAALREAIDAGQTVSVLQVDLDAFSELNAGAGREAGDAVIAAALDAGRGVAEREGWSWSRTGGDEQTLVAVGVSLEAAFLAAEGLRTTIDEAVAKVLPEGFECGASVGVSNVPRDGKSADEALSKADLALYSAKEQGGGRVGLTPGHEMVLKSSYYGVAQLGRLRALAERLKRKESVLLREALDDLLRKYDRS